MKPAAFHRDIMPLIGIPVPANLDRAVGYYGPGRFMGLYWTPAGDELVVTDGTTSVCGGSWYGYLAYVQHPRVVGSLARFNFGFSDLEPDWMLILDRELNHLYAAPMATGKQYFSRLAELGLTPKCDPKYAMLEGESTEEFLARLKRITSAPKSSLEDIQKRMEQESSEVDAMLQWLG